MFTTQRYNYLNTVLQCFCYNVYRLAIQRYNDSNSDTVLQIHCKSRNIACCEKRCTNKPALYFLRVKVTWWLIGWKRNILQLPVKTVRKCRRCRRAREPWASWSPRKRIFPVSQESSAAPTAPTSCVTPTDTRTHRHFCPGSVRRLHSNI